MINEQIIKKSEPQVHYSDIHEILTHAHINVVHAFTAKYIIFELDDNDRHNIRRSGMWNVV